MTDQRHLTTSDLAAVPSRDSRPDSGDSSSTPQLVGEAGPAADAGDEPRSSRPQVDSFELLDRTDRESFHDRWRRIQIGFVDDPREAVEHADALVAEAMKRLAEIFAQERQSLEAQWGEGTSVSTEDLRVALQRYRAFFQRLLVV